MTKLEIEKTILKAIENSQSIKIKFKYGLGNETELLFDPYIYGSDTMQYEFVWGFLPESLLHYRLMADFIISAKLTNTKFEVQSDSMYLYSIEEEHRCRVAGMQEPKLRVYAQGIDLEN